MAYKVKYKCTTQGCGFSVMANNDNMEAVHEEINQHLIANTTHEVAMRLVYDDSEVDVGEGGGSN